MPESANACAWMTRTALSASRYSALIASLYRYADRLNATTTRSTKSSTTARRRGVAKSRDRKRRCIGAPISVGDAVSHRNGNHMAIRLQGWQLPKTIVGGGDHHSQGDFDERGRPNRRDIIPTRFCAVPGIIPIGAVEIAELQTLHFRCQPGPIGSVVGRGGLAIGFVRVYAEEFTPGQTHG